MVSWCCGEGSVAGGNNVRRESLGVVVVLVMGRFGGCVAKKALGLGGVGGGHEWPGGGWGGVWCLGRGKGVGCWWVVGVGWWGGWEGWG